MSSEGDERVLKRHPCHTQHRSAGTPFLLHSYTILCGHILSFPLGLLLTFKILWKIKKKDFILFSTIYGEPTTLQMLSWAFSYVTLISTVILKVGIIVLVLQMRDLRLRDSLPKLVLFSLILEL